MKKTISLLLCIFTVLLMAGCAVEEPEVIGYKVYYVNNEVTRLVEEAFSPTAEDAESIIQEMLEKLAAPLTTGATAATDRKSVFPDNVKVENFELKGNHLMVNFNKDYYEMDNVTEVLLKSAVVKTLVQLDEVKDVTFFIEEQELTNAKKEVTGPMDGALFVDSKGEGINSYQFASLALYFADDTGSQMVKEQRNVHYSTNTTLEKVVLEQLKAGPVNSKLQAVMPTGIRSTSILVNEGTCTVNLDKTSLSGGLASQVTPEVSVYAIVNSLIDSCSLNEVQLQVDGESNVTYLESISLEQPFQRNKDIIRQIETMTEEGESTVEGEQEKSTIPKSVVGIDSGKKEENK